MKAYLDAYLQHLKNLNYSPNTIKQRKSMLNNFISYLRERNFSTPEQIRRDDLEEYLSFKRQSKNKFESQDSPLYQNQTLVCIREFFKFLKKEGYLNIDPSSDLEFVRVPKRLPNCVLTHQEFKQIIKEVDPHTSIGYRDRTILEVLYSSAIRRNELLTLKVKDVDYVEGLALVNGKGNKERRVPLGKTACQYLENYIRTVRPMLEPKNKPGEYLFLSNAGTRLKETGFKKLIDKYVLQSGIEKAITPHAFRRGATTGMIKNRANVMLVKDMLGHETLDTIKHYLKLNIEDLKAEHKRTHPREKK